MVLLTDFWVLFISSATAKRRWLVLSIGGCLTVTNQLRMYINDLTGNENSLTYGLFDEGELVGLSMGYVMHWYMATEYYIFELCIRTDRQGEGLGTYFLDEMEKELLAHDIKQIYLQTEENVPAYEFYKKRGFFVLNGHMSLGKNIDG